MFIKWHLYEKLENWIRDDTIENLDNFLDLLKQKFDVKFISIDDIDDLYLNGKLKNVNEI